MFQTCMPPNTYNIRHENVGHSESVFDLSGSGILDDCQQACHGFVKSVFQLTFPHCDDNPMQTFQFGFFDLVTFLSSRYLIQPPFSSCLWNNEISTSFMAMPKTAIHKYHYSPVGNYDIRSTRQISVVLPVTDTMGIQPFTCCNFWLCFLGTYPGHTMLSLFWRHHIRHCVLPRASQSYPWRR